MRSEDLSQALSDAAADMELKILAETKLCDSCLGRLFARVGKGVANETRGIMVRKLLNIETSVSPNDCAVCGGLTSRTGYFVELALEALNEWEFGNFLVGTKVSPEIQAIEENVWAETRTEHSEPIKAELNREIGKILESSTGKPAEFAKPDIVVILDTTYESTDVQVSPLYFYGRYQKRTRGIPQTRWPCRACAGKGCERCDHTGKMYQDSVEELIGRIALKHTGGKDHRFHGMGREDIDALMLGTGRPFVFEVKEPKKRTLDLKALEKDVNESTEHIRISDLRPSDSNEVVQIKSARLDKKYRVKISFDEPVGEEKFKEVVASFGDNSISQWTPKRVAHRRADRERKRQIKGISLQQISPAEVVIEIVAEAGTYIKEFVHGDDGRTKPSISGQLGMKCEVKTLDVLEIMENE